MLIKLLYIKKNTADFNNQRCFIIKISSCVNSVYLQGFPE